MPARYDERKVWRPRPILTVQKSAIDMRLEMVDRDDRFSPPDREPFRGPHSNQQRPQKPRIVGHRYRRKVSWGDAAFGDDLVYRREYPCDMVARRYLGNDPAEKGMDARLRHRPDRTHAEILIHHRRRGVVAARLYAEDEARRHAVLRMVLERFAGISARCRRPAYGVVGP